MSCHSTPPRGMRARSDRRRMEDDRARDSRRRGDRRDDRAGGEHSEDVDYWESDDGSERRLEIRMEGDQFPRERLLEIMQEHGIEVDEMHFGSESGEHEFRFSIGGEEGHSEEHEVRRLALHGLLHTHTKTKCIQKYFRQAQH